jgi:hypothetical protein
VEAIAEVEEMSSYEILTTGSSQLIALGSQQTVDGWPLKVLRMTLEETEKFKDLCTQIIAEKNEVRYAELVRQLDAIMETKEQRLRNQGDTSTTERGGLS